MPEDTLDGYFRRTDFKSGAQLCMVNLVSSVDKDIIILQYTPQD